jgi:hypothetical protein
MVSFLEVLTIVLLLLLARFRVVARNALFDVAALRLIAAERLRRELLHLALYCGDHGWAATAVGDGRFCFTLAGMVYSPISIGARPAPEGGSPPPMRGFSATILVVFNPAGGEILNLLKGEVISLSQDEPASGDRLRGCVLGPGCFGASSCSIRSTVICRFC